MPSNDAKSKMLKDQMGSFKSGKAGSRGGRGGKPVGKGRGGRGGGGGGGAGRGGNSKAVRVRRDTEFLEKLNPYEIGAEYWVSDPKIVWKQCKCTAFDNWKVTVQFDDGATKTIDLRYEYAPTTHPLPSRLSCHGLLLMPCLPRGCSRCVRRRAGLRAPHPAVPSPFPLLLSQRMLPDEPPLRR